MQDVINTNITALNQSDNVDHSTILLGITPFFGGIHHDNIQFNDFSVMNESLSGPVPSSFMLTNNYDIGFPHLISPPSSPDSSNLIHNDACLTQYMQMKDFLKTPTTSVSFTSDSLFSAPSPVLISSSPSDHHPFEHSLVEDYHLSSPISPTSFSSLVNTVDKNFNSSRSALSVLGRHINIQR